VATKKLEVQVKTKGVDKSSKDFDRMRVKTEGVERAVGQLRNKLLLFTFATAAVVGVVTKLTQASSEQEKIFNTLENSINITGASYDNLKSSLDDTFASLQKTTIYGDTDTAQVLQKLIILTGDYDTAMVGLELSLDLAASGLFDASTASRMVGMALTGNIEMLGRYIPEFKAATNEALKHMDASEKVAFAIETLREKFGGLAEKELNTSIGKWKQFLNYWGDLNEAIGDNFLGTLKEVTTSLTPLVDEWTTAIKLHQTSVDLASSAYIGLGASAKAAILGHRIALLEHSIELERAPNKLQIFTRSFINSSNAIIKAEEKIFGIGSAVLGTYEAIADVMESVFGLEAGTIIDEDKIKKANEEIAKLRSELIGITDIKLDDDDGGLLPEFDPDIEGRVNTAIDNMLAKQVAYFDEQKAIEDENLERQKEIYETKKTAEDAYQQQLQDSADKELKRIGLITEAIKAKIMMEEAAFRMAEKHDGDAIGAAKEVIRNEAKEALAGYISSVLTGVPYPANLILAAGAGALVNPLFNAIGLHNGGDFIVPPGYPNDSFPIMVESGERVQVTPSSETGNSNNSETNELLRALLAKPVANTVVFDDVSMSQYVDRGRKNRNSNIL
jgi:murein DD-endopeptidase MepM/ murein hydrolase activator NlpD